MANIDLPQFTVGLSGPGPFSDDGGAVSDDPRKASQTADFHVCRACGVIPIVTSTIDGTRYAVINVNTFDSVDRSQFVETVMDFEGEATPDGLARRRRNWTPEARGGENGIEQAGGPFVSDGDIARIGSLPWHSPKGAERDLTPKAQGPGPARGGVRPDGPRGPAGPASSAAPSFMSHLIASATLSIPGMILGETALSFLGLGVRAPMVSWGVLLNDAQNVNAIALTPG